MLQDMIDKSTMDEIVSIKYYTTNFSPLDISR